MHFGSTEREEDLPEDVKIAKKVRDQTATIAGCSIELQIQKQQLELLSKRLDAQQGQLTTLLHEVRMLRELHAKNLHAILGGGPTE